MKTLFHKFLVIFLVILLSSYTEKDKKNDKSLLDQQKIDLAKKYENKGEYEKAVNVYRKLLKDLKRKPKTDKKITAENTVIFNLAECYRKTGLTRRAEPLYRRLIRRKYENPVIYLLLGDCLKSNGKKAQAEAAYMQYKEYRPRKNKWNEEMKKYESIDSKKNKDMSDTELRMESIANQFQQGLYLPGENENIPTGINGKEGESIKDNLIKDGKLDVISLNEKLKNYYMSTDDDFIFFSAKIDGGVGGADIWQIEKAPDGSWGNPKCMDSTVNTTGDEINPVVSPEGNLFFASNKHLGLGGFDIYKARLDGNEEWKIENIGFPLNSVENDVAISFTRGEGEGSVITNRNNRTTYDIYSFTSVNPSVRGTVKDLYTNDYLEGVDIELAMGESPISLFLTNRLGEYYFDLKYENNYILRITKKDFLSMIVPIQKEQLRESKDYVKNYTMYRTDTTSIIRDIFFNGKDFDVDKSREAIVNMLYAIFANPGVKMEVRIFTNEHSEDKNILLTKAQAKSLQAFFKQRGIERSQVAVQGFGNVPVTASIAISKLYDNKIIPGYELSPAYIKM